MLRCRLDVSFSPSLSSLYVAVMSVLLMLSIVQPMTEFLNAYPRVLILIKWDASCHSRPSSVTPSRFESSFYLVCSDLHCFFSYIFFKTFIKRLLSSTNKNYHEVCKTRTRTGRPRNTPKTLPNSLGT